MVFAVLRASILPRFSARRANALKYTCPKTARGTAWSSMSGLRNGWDARSLRAKIERTGDKELLVLFDCKRRRGPPSPGLWPWPCAPGGAGRGS